MRHAALFVIASLLVPVAARAQGAPPIRDVSALEISGPYTHGNLSVFLFHGPDLVKGGGLASLEEALDRKQVVITERGEVNTLWARNVGKVPVYLQGGDIVKGGRQDRVLEQDTILEPGGKAVQLAVFCVEQGRWQGRGAEPVGHFSSSKNVLVTRKQKLAARAAADQGEVWRAVAEAQDQIARKVAAPIKASQSATSLQLSLESQKVKDSADPAVAALLAVADKRPDTVGYAFAVDGQISAADVYASPALFRKLWPRLLRASAVEALAEAGPGVAAAPVTTEAVRGFVNGAERGQSSRRRLSPRTSVERKETPEAVMFDTSDAGNGDLPIHKSYLRK
jgi:hypothetical protein